MGEQRSKCSPRWGLYLLGLSVLLFSFIGSSVAEENVTETKKDGQCQEGLLIPLWMPQHGLSTADKVARAIVYFLAMIWLFIGVSIVADRFMGSIEMITSQEKEVKIKKPNGEVQIIVVQVWNETVANLTLMALGSSAPEILLSVIEMFATKFEAGDLGPGTIVGSAAFNLFVIIGICVYVIPDGEVRYIKHLRVFVVTAFFSIFAYIWLYLILAVISEGIVELWEALLTFMFFPITVGWAYAADRRLLVYKFLTKEYRMTKRGVIIEMEAGEDAETRIDKNKEGPVYDDNVDDTVKEFEEHRKEFMAVIRELRQKHPDISMENLESMARDEIINRGPKSRAFYRIQATRKLTGGGNIMKKTAEKKQDKVEDSREKKDDDTIRVFFDPGHYTVMESVGSFDVTVVREGGDLNTTVLVDYKTEDGSANGIDDYIAVQGTLVFLPGETQKSFSIEVIDDDVFEEDEHFYTRLSNLRFGSPDGTAVTHAVNGAAGQPNKQNKLELSAPFVVTIMILDDDHGGIFNVGDRDVEIVETIGIYEMKVARVSGARGRVMVPYHTQDGTGKAGKDYEAISGELVFENNETEKWVEIAVIEEDSYEKDVVFFFNIGEPEAQGGWFFGKKGFEFENADSKLSEAEKIALLGKPKLGPNTRCQIRVKENKEYKNMVDKLVKKANASILVGSSSWKEQFIEAVTVSAGGDDDEGDEEGGEDEEAAEREEKLPSCSDYVMHFVTVFWKIMFAFVPPTDYLSGYPTFVLSIMGIGLLTAFIGDFASQLGCTIGLKDTITAIGFVALGTSVPEIMSGYPTFVVSIAGIGFLTAVIGDLASHVGCTIGLKDTITAIGFVALGTSVPDILNGYPTFVISISGIGFLTAFIGDFASHLGCTIGLKDTITAIGFVALGTSVPEILGGYACFAVSIFCLAILTTLIGDVSSHVGCTIHLKDSVTAIVIVAIGTSVPDRHKGWECFVISIVSIGFLTAVLGDVASHFGCTIGLKDTVTAISIVALGTSVPDTFASKVAAQQDPYADASVGNVTGSNGVNVFLGIGIAWSMAAIYHNLQGNDFRVKPGNLAFSVTLFCVEAFVTIAIMMARRHPSIGGELGGPRLAKVITSYFLVFLWVFYVFMSTLEAYGIIPSI